MLREQGTVEEVDGIRVRVRVQRGTACDTCSSRGSCHVRSDQEMVVDAMGAAGVKIGDRVELAVPEGSVLKLSAMIYIAPVGGLIAGALAGAAWAETRAVDATWPALVGAVLVTALVYAVLRRIDKRRGMSALPRITRILPSGPSSTSRAGNRSGRTAGTAAPL